LARLLHAEGSDEAKRQVLMALEEAPRYQDAQRLLLTLVKKESKDTSPARQEEIPAEESEPIQKDVIDIEMQKRYGLTPAQISTQPSIPAEEQPQSQEDQ
jgi:hypothetical protein